MTNELEQQILDMGCDHVHSNGGVSRKVKGHDDIVYNVIVYTNGISGIETNEMRLWRAYDESERTLFYHIHPDGTIYDMDGSLMFPITKTLNQFEEIIETHMPVAQFNEAISGLKQIVESDEFTQYTAEMAAKTRK